MPANISRYPDNEMASRTVIECYMVDAEMAESVCKFAASPRVQVLSSR